MNNKMRVLKFIRYESFAFVGLIIAVGALIKLMGIYDFSSDWFWFLAGIGLIVQGLISLIKQRKFDKKFKIIAREEEKK